MTGILGFADHAVILFWCKVVEIVVDWILGLTFESDFVVKVWTGRLAGVADFANEITTFDLLPRLDKDLRQMGVAGRVVEPM